MVSASRDNGRTWQNVTSKIPGFPLAASSARVVPSRFDAGTVYVTSPTIGHDYAVQTRRSARTSARRSARSTGDLRGGSRTHADEDLKNPDVLYIGTATGIFLTLDRGKDVAGD